MNSRDASIASWLNNPLDLWIILSVLLLTIVTFSPTLTNGFVNWDDDVNLVNHPFLETFDWNSILGIFSSTVIGNYNPLPIFTFAIERYFFGLDPFVFHFNNLLLHLISVILVFHLAKRVGCTSISSGIAAGIFAIHPMHVESVAWVTQRKDVLFGLFFLAACLSYLKYVGNGRRGNSVFLVYLFFTLSCLSKIQAVAFPLALLGFDFLLEKRWGWNLLKEKIGLFAISILVGVGGVIALKNFGSLDETNFSILERFLLFWSFKNEKKKLFFASWFFIVTIFFVLQFLGAGQAFLADRFSYLPYIGLAIGVGYLIDHLLHDYSKWKMSIIALPIFFLMFFAQQSFHQTQVWNSSESLWTNAINIQPDLHVGFHNRGLYHAKNNSTTNALNDLNQAIRLAPAKANYYNSRGKVYVSRNEPYLALSDYSKAIELTTDEAMFYNHRSVAYSMIGKYSEGLQDVNQALALDPNYADAYLNRALIFAYMHQFDDALQDNLSYLEMHPSAQEIWVEAGMNARMTGNNTSADQYLKRALSLKPNDSNALEELALLR